MFGKKTKNKKTSLNDQQSVIAEVHVCFDLKKHLLIRNYCKIPGSESLIMAQISIQDKYCNK